MSNHNAKLISLMLTFLFSLFFIYIYKLLRYIVTQVSNLLITGVYKINIRSHVLSTNFEFCLVKNNAQSNHLEYCFASGLR